MSFQFVCLPLKAFFFFFQFFRFIRARWWQIWLNIYICSFKPYSVTLKSFYGNRIHQFGVHVSMALRGKCLSAVGRTFWNDYTQAPGTIRPPLWQLSQAMSRISQWQSTVASRLGATRVHSCFWNSKKEKEIVEMWLQAFPQVTITFISSVSWSFCAYVPA